MQLASNHQPTILLIDDTTTNLKVAMQYLSAYSFDILIAHDGETGIERAKLARPDLILLDVQMPGIDGFETCRRLKASPITSKIPVILMTVFTETAYKVRGLEAGAVDYLTKPIDEAELLARVNTHIKLYHLQEQLETRVRERTAALEEEMARRAVQEQEKAELMELVRQQSEQLRQLTQLLLDNEDSQHSQLQAGQEQVDRDLLVLEQQLDHAAQLLASSPTQPQAAELALQTIRDARQVLDHVRQESRQLGTNLEEVTSIRTNLRANPLFKLSDREYEIFQLLAQGKSLTEIGKLLYLAKTTVSTYRQRIMEKLDVADPAELARFASQYGQSA